MTTRQGDVSLLNDPVAQRMLQSKTPACFVYNWSDGTPRVAPIGFHWNGAEIVLGTPVDAPKMKALHDGADHRQRHDALQRPADSRPGAYRRCRRHCAGVRRHVQPCDGEAGTQEWLANLRPMSPQMARIFIKPTWVGILDFKRGT